MNILRKYIRNLIMEATKFVCPPATQDLELNTNNRNKAIQEDHIKYGPMNLNDKKYWKELAKFWKTDEKTAKKSLCSNCAAFDISPQMEECMPGSIQKDGRLGYCWMHKFKCHSARTCYTWAAGGPIETNEVSNSWGDKEAPKEDLSESKSRGIMAIVKQHGGKRIPKEGPWAPSQYQFPDESIAAKVVWLIHDATGREAVNDGSIVSVYK